MAYYNYHAKLKDLISNYEYFVTKEKGKFAYRFHFPELGKSMPIRDYRVEEYFKYIRRLVCLKNSIG